MTTLRIRPARAAERAALEDLQRRAALALPDYRARIEAHPDAIDLSAVQIARGRVLVAEEAAGIAGFAARLDGEGADEAALDGLYRRCGFAEAGETQTRFGPAPVMVRSTGP